MSVHFIDQAWLEERYWFDTDRSILERLNDLIEDIGRSPLQGIGKPEPLRGPLQGLRSRRIMREHRLVHAIAGTGRERHVVIVQCRPHY